MGHKSLTQGISMQTIDGQDQQANTAKSQQPKQAKSLQPSLAGNVHSFFSAIGSVVEYMVTHATRPYIPGNDDVPQPKFHH